MLQFGCFRASSTCIFLRSSDFLPRNGPPEAVSKILLILLFPAPCNDWKIALCSLSTGRIGTLYSFASGIIICPAVTSVSLFAKAIFFPALIAAIVGLIPSIPTIAVTKISLSGITDTSRSPSMLDTIFMPRSFVFVRSSDAFFSSHTLTSDGLNSLICASNKLILLPAAIATT